MDWSLPLQRIWNVICIMESFLYYNFLYVFFDNWVFLAFLMSKVIVIVKKEIFPQVAMLAWDHGLFPSMRGLTMWKYWCTNLWFFYEWCPWCSTYVNLSYFSNMVLERCWGSLMFVDLDMRLLHLPMATTLGFLYF